MNRCACGAEFRTVYAGGRPWRMCPDCLAAHPVNPVVTLEAGPLEAALDRIIEQALEASRATQQIEQGRERAAIATGTRRIMDITSALRRVITEAKA